MCLRSLTALSTADAAPGCGIMQVIAMTVLNGGQIYDDQKDSAGQDVKSTRIGMPTR